MNHTQPVVITGIGAISPVGLDIDTSWHQLIAGQSGIEFITAFDTTGFETTFAGEVKDFDPENYMDRKDARRMDRFAQLLSLIHI